MIGEVAAGVPIGPWVAHVSGATRLAALDPHERRFSVHPLQTLTRERGPEQLDGAWGAISGETDDALGARALAGGDARPPRRSRSPMRTGPSTTPPPSSAATSSSRCRRVATRLLEEVGAPPEAIVPLMTRTIENGFDLTGPIARGDWTTVEAHLAALEERDPDLVPLYRALAEATRP